MKVLATIGLAGTLTLATFAAHADTPQQNPKTSGEHSVEHHAAKAHHRQATSSVHGKPVVHTAVASGTAHRAGPATNVRTVTYSRRRHHYYERFTANSFATSDLTAADITAGE